MSNVPEVGLRAEIFGEGTRTVVQVSGEIDIATASVLGDVLDLAMERAASVVVDLGEVSFMDSSGALVLARAAALAVDRRGTLAVRAARPQVRKVLVIVGLGELLTDGDAAPEEG
jgi:anti-sigma B factor antagonist